MTLLLDILGASLSLIGAYFYVKENPLAWPISALAMPFDIYLYLSKGLIADTMLQASYFLSTVYGWYHWCYGGEKKTHLKISFITRRHVINLTLLGSMSYVLVLSFVFRFTSLKIAVFDTLACVLSVIGQWLMCRKVLQTWILLILVDIIYISLYLVKGVPFHAVMMMVYLVMAMIGWFEWQAHFKKNLAPAQLRNPVYS